ncbi:MAG: MotE family protein [Bacillota bacterium]
MGKVIKILAIAIILLLMASVAAMYFGIVKPPKIIKDIPFLGKILTSTEKDEEVTPAATSELDELKMELEDTRLTIEQLENENAELQRQLSEVQKDRDNLEALNEELNTKNKQWQRLAEYYSNMKAKQAAAIMAELDDDTVVGILANMGTETAASIIGELDPRQAAVLTNKMLQVKGGE